MGNHSKRIELISGKRDGSTLKPGQLTTGMVEAVKRIYGANAALATKDHGVVVSSVAQVLKTRKAAIGTWSDDQVATALDYLADTNQITFAAGGKFAA